MIVAIVQLSVHHGNGGHVHDLTNGAAELQHVNRLLHAQQNGTDRLRPTNLHQQLVGYVTRREVREDERVGRFIRKLAERKGLLLKLRIQRDVRLDVALHNQGRVSFSNNLDSFFRFRRYVAFR